MGRPRSDRWAYLAPRLFVLLGASLIASIAADRLAGLVVPATVPQQIAHPPNLVEERNTIEFSYEFRSNSMGLRYRELPLARRHEGEFRMALAGDSFTEGYGMPDGERFSELLEASLSTAEHPASVINCGLSGTGPAEYGRTLLAVCAKYHLDLAVAVVFTNDLHDTSASAALGLRRNRRGEFEMPTGTAPTYEPGSTLRRVVSRIWPWSYARLRNWSVTRDQQRLKSAGFLHFVEERARREHIPDSAVAAWRARIPPRLLEAAEHGRFNGSALALGLFEPNIWVESLDLDGDRARTKWVAMRRVLDDIMVSCRQLALTCAVVYAPTTVQYDQARAALERVTGIRVRPEWMTGRSELERALDDWAASKSVPFFSMTEDFRRAAAARPGTLNFEFDGHWTAAGHHVAASAIGRWLRTQHLLPAGRTANASR